MGSSTYRNHDVHPAAESVRNAAPRPLLDKARDYAPLVLRRELSRACIVHPRAPRPPAARHGAALKPPHGLQHGPPRPLALRHPLPPRLERGRRVAVQHLAEEARDNPLVALPLQSMMLSLIHI